MFRQCSIFFMGLLLAATSCKTLKDNKNAAIGAGTGVAVGGAIGGLLGKKNNNTAGGVIIGAAVGGVAGGAIGKYMDKQKRELEQKMGQKAEVERVGEGIKVTFDSGILFAVNSANLTPDMKKTLTDFVNTLKEYDDTYILIDGHTDATGSESHNQQLSDKRANSVYQYLNQQGVANSRMGTRGFGELQPVADNGTEDGRRKNRRVEVAIWANEELKKKAADGTLNK